VRPRACRATEPREPSSREPATDGDGASVGTVRVTPSTSVPVTVSLPLLRYPQAQLEQCERDDRPAPVGRLVRLECPCIAGHRP
jgi:hypothetical protein